MRFRFRCLAPGGAAGSFNEDLLDRVLGLRPAIGEWPNATFSDEVVFSCNDLVLQRGSDLRLMKRRVAAAQALASLLALLGLRQAEDTTEASDEAVADRGTWPSNEVPRQLVVSLSAASMAPPARLPFVPVRTERAA